MESDHDKHSSSEERQSVQSFGSFIKSSSSSSSRKSAYSRHSSKITKNSIGKLRRTSIRSTSIQAIKLARHKSTPQKHSASESEDEDLPLKQLFKQVPPEQIEYFQQVTERAEARIALVEDKSKQGKYRRKLQQWMNKRLITPGSSLSLSSLEMNEEILEEPIDAFNQFQENQSDYGDVDLEHLESLRRKHSEYADSLQSESWQIRDLEYNRYCILFQQDRLSENSHSSDGASSQSSEFISLNKIKKKYEQQYTRNAESDPYYIHLVKYSRWKRLFNEFRTYRDKLCLLKPRKTLVMILGALTLVCEDLVEGNLYKVYMSIVIILNLSLFVYANVLRYYTPTIVYYQEVLIALYASELALKVVAHGLVKSRRAFLKQFGNWFDTLILAGYSYHVQHPDLLIVDITPIRMLRLLSYLGSIFGGLGVMLEAITQSIKNMTEALMILLIFLTFFACVGMHLFQGLLSNRCMDLSTGVYPETIVWSGCGFYTCDDGTSCVSSLNTPQITTSFNSAEYTFGQLFRTVACDDWSFPMYFHMRAFHPQVWIYYILVIFVCGYFGFNMLVVVLKTHYSNVTSGHQAQEFEKRRLLKHRWIYEETEDHNKDDSFSVKVLKELGFYEALKSRKLIFEDRSLRGSQLEIPPPERIGPRTLSGKMQSIESKKKEMTPVRQLVRCFTNLSFRMILLPNYWKMRNIDRSLNMAPTNEKTAAMLQQLNKQDLMELQPDVVDMEYMSSSMFDTLELSDLPFLFGKRKEQDFKLLRSTKLKVFYSSSSKHLNLLAGLPHSHLQGKLPIRGKFRLRQEQSNLSSSSQSSLPPVKPNRDYSIHGSRSFIPVELPFSVEKGSMRFVRVWDKYIDYDAMCRIMNQRLGPIKVCGDESIIEEKYLLLRKKELKKKLIRHKNWSGKNVLVSYWQSPVLGVAQLKHRYMVVIDSLNRKDLEIWLLGFRGYITVGRKHIYYWLNHRLTKLFFDGVVCINMVFLALDGIVSEAIISKVSDVITVVLLAEILLKIFAFNPKRFAKNRFHLLESTIIIISFVQFFISEKQLSVQYLKIMRATKCLLIYRCLKYYGFAVIVYAIAKKTYRQYIYLTFFLFFMILTYGLIGMELYAGEFDPSSQLGQLHNYDDPVKAFLTVFNILTNDDWYGVLYMGAEVNKYLALLYSYSMMFVINYLTYCLVIAVLLDGFGKYLNEEEDNSENEFFQRKERAIDTLRRQLDSDDSNKVHSSSSSSRQHYQNIPSSSSEGDIMPPISSINLNSMLRTSNSAIANLSRPSFTNDIVMEQRRLKERVNKGVKIKGQQSKALIMLIQSIKMLEKRIRRTNSFANVKCKSSLFLFDRDSRVRQLAFLLTSNIYQSFFTDAVVLLSCLTMCLQTYDDDLSSGYSRKLWHIQFACNLTILIEIILKIISVGMWMDQGSYFNYVWKYVDAIYTVSYFLKLAEQTDYLPIIHLLQYLGYLRPMKFLFRIKQVTRIRDALALSLSDIVNVVIVLVGVWLMFAIFGMTLYKNQFSYCDDWMNFGVSKAQCNGTWINYRHNFDNITQAMPTLFVISSFDGWGQILQISYNTQGPDLGPSPWASLYPTLIFYVLFVFIGAMFFLSFFTGVLYINFKHHARRLENKEYTQEQMEFIKISQLIFKDRPRYSSTPQSLIRIWGSAVVRNRRMRQVLLLVLLIDTVAQLMYRTDVSHEFMTRLDYIYQSITVLMTFWVTCQFLRFGLWRFFEHGWRRLELLVVVINVTDLILDITVGWFQLYLLTNSQDPYFQMLRLFLMLRDLRILLVFQGFITLRRLMRVMSFAIPYLAKILFILLCVFVCYALIGCQLYGDIDKGEVIDNLINFSNVGTAMLTLFRVAMQDNWRTVMTDLMHYNPYCSEDPKYCGRPFPQLYFISFMVISLQVILNLFILGLIDQFESFHNVQHSCIQTYTDHIDHIKTVWCKYTSETKGEMMHIKFLAKFLLDVGEPLGGKKNDNIWDVAKLASSFKIKADFFGYISFNQLMYEMVRKHFKDQIFKKGRKSAIDNIKLHDKEMTFRLVYQRKSHRQQRSNIGPQLNLKGNFNILRDYFAVLTAFKSWENYSRKMITAVLQREELYTEHSDNQSLNSQQKLQNFSQLIDHQIDDDDEEVQSKHNLSLDINNEREAIPYYKRLCRLRHKVQFLDEPDDAEWEPNDLLMPDDGPRPIRFSQRELETPSSYDVPDEPSVRLTNRVHRQR